MFECDHCGECCKHISGIPELKEYDMGDGVCKNLHDNICLIYEYRPLVCRVDDYYQKFLMGTIDITAYYENNKTICDFLKNHNKNIIFKES
jgi:hypothetical protein